MPALIKVSRDAAQPSFCQTVLSAPTMGNSRRSFFGVAKYWFARPGCRASSRSEAIDLLRPASADRRTPGIFNDAKAFGEVARRRNYLASLCMALMFVASYAVAGAQTAITLSVTPPPSGSVYKMTAQVKSDPATLGVGTVTFRDTYNGI